MAFLIMPIMADEIQIPTDEEIWNWFLKISFQEKLDLIRNYYIIEHTVPEINFPGYTAVLTNENDLIVFPDEEKGTIQIDYLSYEIEMPQYSFPGFIKPKSEIGNYFLIGGTCLIGGLIIGLIIPD